jgi:hypothetical protein
VSDRSTTSDFGKLSRVQHVSSVHLKALGQFVSPESTSDGGADGSTNTGPEREQGDGGTHVSVRNSGLNGDLGPNDGASTLDDDGKKVLQTRPTDISQNSSATHADSDKDLTDDQDGIALVAVGSQELQTHTTESKVDR